MNIMPVQNIELNRKNRVSQQNNSVDVIPIIESKNNSSKISFSGKNILARLADALDELIDTMIKGFRKWQDAQLAKERAEWEALSPEERARRIEAKIREQEAMDRHSDHNQGPI